jgi:HEPN domain-containing protein
LRADAAVNRADLRSLANARLRDAEGLFANRRYSGAYYLGGYAVECAIKACIAKNTRRGEFPEKEKVNRSYTHDLQQLIGVAGLRQPLQAREKVDANFSANWARVITWSEAARYEGHGRQEAQGLLQAISDATSGVLQWLLRQRLL